MAQRPQVGQFQGPTQANLRPVASPVDTYVKPVSQPQGPSALSQFVSAISPAIEAQAEERKVERLKREKEVADGVQKNKEFQLRQRAKRLIGELGMDYVKNETAYKDLDQDVVRNHWRTQKNDYLTELEKVSTDPLLMQTFDQNIEAALETFMQETFIPAKVEHTQGLLLSDFADSMRDTNRRLELGLTTKKDAIESIREDVAGFHSANPDYFNFKDNKVNDELVALAMANDNVNSAVTLYLQSSASRNQLGNKSRYAVQSGTIEAKQNEVEKKRLKAQAKSDALSNVMASLATDPKPSSLQDLTYTNPVNGDIIKITEAEAEQAFLTHVQGKGAGESFALMAKTNFVPKAIKAQVTDALPFLTGGNNPDTVEDLQALKQALTTYELMKNSGIDVSFLGEDAEPRLQALSVLARDEAQAGIRTIVTDTFDAFGDLEEYDVQDLSSIALRIQGIDTTRTMDKAFKDAVTDSVSTNYFSADLTDVFNKGEVLEKAMKVANILNQVGGYESPEAVAAAAMSIVEADNPIVKSGDGTPYAFAHLNTNIDASMDVVSTVNEYNELLQGSTILQNYLFKSRTMMPEDYVVALYPDPVNPKSVILKGYDLRNGTPSPFTIGGKMSKTDLFSDRNQLNTLIGQVATQEDFFPTTGITPDLGGMSQSAKDIEYNLSKVESLSDVSDYVGGGDNAELPLGETPVVQDILDSFVGFSAEEKAEAARLAEQSGNKLLSEITSFLSRPTPSDEGTMGESIVKGLQNLLGGTGEVATPIESDKVSSLVDTVGETVSNVASVISDTDFSLIGSANASVTDEIIGDEGFRAAQYDDMGQPSVGHGLQVASLEPDELALIEDIDNVKPEESKAVVQLKVQKTAEYFSSVVDGFDSLPATAKSAMIQMGYQLGRFNVTKEWPKFMEAINEATQYAEGSVEQGKALAKAKFNMLYNVAEDGTLSATKWATQTADRAMKVASTLASNVQETAGDVVAAVSDAIIPSANASSEITPAKVGVQPKGEDVVAMATAPDFVTAALKYMDIDEGSKNGARAVEAMFNNIVGGKAFKGTPEQVAKANAWCAAFVAQVLADSGIDANNLIGGKDKYAATRAKSYLNVGKPVKLANAQAGDIMIKVHTKAERDKYFKDKGEKLTAFGHAGIVIRSEDGELYFIGGNSNDKVKFSSYGHDKDLRIRRIDGVTKTDVDNLPSIREMEWGIAGTAVDKLENAWKSMVDLFD